MSATQEFIMSHPRMPAKSPAVSFQSVDPLAVWWAKQVHHHVAEHPCGVTRAELTAAVKAERAAFRLGYLSPDTIHVVVCPQCLAILGAASDMHRDCERLDLFMDGLDSDTCVGSGYCVWWTHCEDDVFQLMAPERIWHGDLATEAVNSGRRIDELLGTFAPAAEKWPPK
jgi:hypothetical protein